MSSFFDDEGPRDMLHRIAGGDPEPKVVIFTGGKRLIEKTHFLKDSTPEHDRRRAYQA